MAFPTTGVLDDFNRSNEQPVTGFSDDPQGASHTQIRIVSNVVENNTGAEKSAGFWDASTFTEAEAFVTLSTKGSNGDETGLYIRLQSPNTAGADGYKAEWSVAGGTDKAELFRCDNTSLTQLGADRNFEITAGDKLGLWADGSTIRFYTDRSGGWLEEFNETDSTYGSAGEIGFMVERDAFVDDFGGGEVVTAGSLLFRRRESVRGAV